MEDFSNTTSYGTSGSGHTYFKVETKEGVVLEYGNTTDSRLMAKNKDGNDVYLEVGVSRFGVRDSKVNLPLKGGDYVAKYDKMNSNSNIKGLRIGGTAYFFHEQWGSGDHNFGCLTMMESSWDSFKGAVSLAGHSSWGYGLNETAIIRVTIISTPYPKIKYP